MKASTDAPRETSPQLTLDFNPDTEALSIRVPSQRSNVVQLASAIFQRRALHHVSPEAGDSILEEILSEAKRLSW